MTRAGTQVLSLMGVKESEENNVSEEELRMIVMGAKISGEIKTEEQDMIESVLDLQVHSRLRVQGLGSGLRVSGFGSGFRVSGLEFRFQGFGFRLAGARAAMCGGQGPCFWSS